MSETHDLDPVIHAVARLRISAVLAALRPDDSLTFSRLQSVLDLTPGNLTTHLAKLEEAQYESLVKRGAGRSASTVIALTAAGRQAYKNYLASLKAILNEQ